MRFLIPLIRCLRSSIKFSEIQSCLRVDVFLCYALTLELEMGFVFYLFPSLF